MGLGICFSSSFIPVIRETVFLPSGIARKMVAAGGTVFLMAALGGE